MNSYSFIYPIPIPTYYLDTYSKWGSWLSLLPYQHGSSSSTKLWCHHRLGSQSFLRLCRYGPHWAEIYPIKGYWPHLGEIYAIDASVVRALPPILHWQVSLAPVPPELLRLWRAIFTAHVTHVRAIVLAVLGHPIVPAVCSRPRLPNCAGPHIFHSVLLLLWLNLLSLLTRSCSDI